MIRCSFVSWQCLAIFYLDDNAQPHVASMTLQMFTDLVAQLAGAVEYFFVECFFAEE